MKDENALEPTQEQLEGFLSPAEDKPIYMVNLLKYRDKAEYADGRETELSGRQAYGLYGMGVVACLEAVGGHMYFSGTVQRLMLGEVEDLWDDVAIAVYPSRAAMLEMIQSPAYQEIHVHRNAGLQGQLNIETNATVALNP